MLMIAMVVKMMTIIITMVMVTMMKAGALVELLSTFTAGAADSGQGHPSRGGGGVFAENCGCCCCSSKVQLHKFTNVCSAQNTRSHLLAQPQQRR